MINWSDSLVKDLSEGRSVVFLGSGILCNSTNAAGERPKAWRALLKKAAGMVNASQKKAIMAYLNRYDYLMACELVKMALGNDRFRDFLVDEFQTPGYLPAAIHEDILNLYANIVITPNFDKIYDSYVTAETHGTIPVLNYYSNGIIDNIRKGKQMVLKIHGTINEPDNLIFSKMDYAKARKDHASFYTVLEALILTKTCLFLGAGLNDPDIHLLLENYSFQYNNSRKHFL